MLIAEYARLDEHGRRSADGGEEPLLVALPTQTLEQALARLQIVGALSAAGKHNHVVLIAADIGEERIGDNFDAVRPGHLPAVVDRRYDRFDSASAENVNYAHRFDFFKAIRERDQRFTHDELLSAARFCTTAGLCAVR
jgi:hypothetical protein